MAEPSIGDALSTVLRGVPIGYTPAGVGDLFLSVSQERVEALATDLARYVYPNFKKALQKRNKLADYRLNPYVVMTTGGSVGLGDPLDFARFLVQTKVPAGLETSFGKLLEQAVSGHYPIDAETRWHTPAEKQEESAGLKGLSQAERSQRRTFSAWREIDTSTVMAGRRYLLSIKSGPSTINDSQVEAMKTAIVQHHQQWLSSSRANYPDVSGIDVVIGLTYGTDRSTNNKENQILLKLLEHDFVPADREGLPGVVVDRYHRLVRVYKRVGRSFWAFMGNPARPEGAMFVFLEVLLALAKALSDAAAIAEIKEQMQEKTEQLSQIIAEMTNPQDSLPQWMANDFRQEELVWLASAMSAFFDP